MSKLIIGILTVTMLLKSSLVIGQEIEDIEQYSIPDKVFYKFIKNQNRHISAHKMKDVLRAVKHYNPRYFGNEGLYNQGLILVLSIMAYESSFRNINGDEGKSIGWMQIQHSTCYEARKYNGIKKHLNLIARWDNIHCGSAELNRLYENLDGNLDLTIKAYNGGLESVLNPKGWGPANRQTDVYLKFIKRKRMKLLTYIQEWIVDGESI